MPIARSGEHTASDVVGHAGREGRVGTACDRLLARAAAALRHVREGAELASLDDRELRDIGVNRYEVAQELKRGRPSLSKAELDALIACAHQVRSETLLRSLTVPARWLLSSLRLRKAAANRQREP